MFEILPASGAMALDGRAWTSRAASAALHAALIGLAVGLTARPPVAGPAALSGEVPIYLPGRPVPPATSPSPPAAPAPPAPAPLPVLLLPVALPPVAMVPPAPPGLAADPGMPPSPGAFVGIPGATVGLPPDAPIEARAADVAPVLLSHPALRYPELLRQAGLEARILVEAVLDSAGRVEPGSLRVVAGGHPMFEAEARAVVLASRYRAGRYGGHAVRVRIQVPVSFALRR